MSESERERERVRESERGGSKKEREKIALAQLLLIRYGRLSVCSHGIIVVQYMVYHMVANFLSLSS